MTMGQRVAEVQILNAHKEEVHLLHRNPYFHLIYSDQVEQYLRYSNSRFVQHVFLHPSFLLF